MAGPWFPCCVRLWRRGRLALDVCFKNNRAISAQFPRCVWSGVPPLCLVWLSNLAFEALALTLALASALALTSASALSLTLYVALALSLAFSVSFSFSFSCNVSFGL